MCTRNLSLSVLIAFVYESRNHLLTSARADVMMLNAHTIQYCILDESPPHCNCIGHSLECKDQDHHNQMFKWYHKYVHVCIRPYPYHGWYTAKHM